MTNRALQNFNALLLHLKHSKDVPQVSIFNLLSVDFFAIEFAVEGASAAELLAHR